MATGVSRLHSEIVFFRRKPLNLRPSPYELHERRAKPQYTLLAIEVSEKRQPESEDLQDVER